MGDSKESNGLIKLIAFAALIGGIALLVYGYNGTQNYQTTLGQLTRMLSNNAQQQYDQYVQYEYIGGIVAALGLGILIFYK